MKETTTPTANPRPASNIDVATVRGFGDEWSHLDQSGLLATEHEELFTRYFGIFPWETIGPKAEGFDLGCGSGRWAKLVAPRVGRIHCIDASAPALEVARRNLAGVNNVDFHLASVDAIPLAEESQDFGYSLGVLHHVPDTQAGIGACVRRLRVGAPFLLYLYYAFDNRPGWFRALWRTSDWVRRVLSRMPRWLVRPIAFLVALLVYWPLARVARRREAHGKDVRNFPLAPYRNLSFYTMRTDALDRFGTRLERRFTKAQIATMMEHAGLEKIVFSETVPFWCAVGFRRPFGGP